MIRVNDKSKIAEVLLFRRSVWDEEAEHIGDKNCKFLQSLWEILNFSPANYEKILLQTDYFHMHNISNFL